MGSIAPQIISYSPEPTPRRFHASEARIKGIMGPIGSGKSSACVMELYLRAVGQKPFEGVRRSRTFIVRNTYPQLKSTTINTFIEWVPETTPDGQPFFVINWQPPIVGRLNIPHPSGDGTRVEWEVYFLPLDRDEDIQNVKGVEITDAWINEACEVPKSALDLLGGRLRYPSKRMGGSNWRGILMDTNPPDDDSWWYQLAEVEKPLGFNFFRQPPAVVKIPKKSKEDRQEYAPNQGQTGLPPAENIRNHDSGWDYYMLQVPGKDQEWIKVFLEGDYGSILSGKPVYPEYSDTLHVSKADLTVYRGLPIVLGFDFGLTPACVICQMSPRGQFRVLDELYAEDMGIRSFARNVVKPHLQNYYGEIPYTAWGDPAGSTRSQTSEVTCLEELNEAGIKTEMASTNEMIKRREAVAGYLSRLTDGEPAFLLSSKCKLLRKGFLGGYHYRKMRVAGTDRYAEVPEKNKFSHIHDALQYACLESEASASSMSKFSPFGGNPTNSARREVRPGNSLAWT